MKKITKLLALTASLFTLFFTGCQTQISDSTVNGDGVKNKPSYLKIIATSEGNVVTFPVASDGERTITPAAIDGNELEFELTATNLTTNITGSATAVEFVANTNSLTEGVIDFPLDVANYKLVLVAKDKATSSIVLTATAYADLRNNDSVRFFLMPVNKGNGKLTLHLYTAGWDLQDGKYKATSTSGYKVETYVTKDLISSDKMSGFEKTFANTDNTSTLPTSAGAFNFPTSQDKSIAAGTYNFVAEFVSIADSSKKYYYSDRLVILPNQKTEAEIGIPPVIGELPTAPTDLYVGYKTPTDADDALYYLAEFNWTDTSNNESHFQLELMDISNTEIQDTTAATKTAIANVTAHGAAAETSWKDLVTSAGANQKTYIFDNSVYSIYDTDTAGGITYYDDSKAVTPAPGGLSKNNNFLGLNLPLGRRYLARLCAVNSAGKSNYTYAIIYSASPYNSFHYGAKQWGADAQEINVFKITYNLVGGAFYEATYAAAEKTTINLEKNAGNYVNKTADVTGINSKKDSVIVYEYQSTDTNKTVIMNPLKVEVNNTPTYAALYNNGNKWSSWKLSSLTESTTFRQTTDTTAVLDPYKFILDGTVVKETGFSNLDLYAVYSSATAKIYNPADYKVTANDIKLYTSAQNTYSSASVTPFTNGNTIGIGGSVTYTLMDAVAAPADWASAINVKYFKDASGTSIDKVAPTFASPVYKVSSDVYTAVTVEPGDWATSWKDHVTTTFTVITGTETFSSDTYYVYAAAAKTYTLLTSDPNDFATNTSVYFTKSADTPVAGDNPAYVKDTFYEKGAAAGSNLYIYILVKNNEKYSKVQLQLNTTSGMPVGTFNANSAQTSISESEDVYTKVSTEPLSWDPTAHYKRVNGTWVQGTAGDTFASTTWYAQSSSTVTNKYDLFCIPTQSVATTSFQATIKAYAGITTNTPYTYPVIFTITE